MHITYLPGDFPLEDVEAIAARLEKSGGIIPGFVPAPVGLLDIRALVYAQQVENRTFIVLPDRNLVSRMAQVARDGRPARWDPPNRMACDLMAFAQAMNLLIEPSIAFHELAHRSGNPTALEELSWFRAADRGAAHEWIDLSQGYVSHVKLGASEPPPSQDLAFPLKRWRRNYVAALKLAELELGLDTPLSKGLEFLRWMYEEFIIAGPAAISGLFYLAPRMAHRSLMKRLRSSDREIALAGIRNAAWDITHLSEFIRHVKAADLEKRRVFLATADRDLAGIAPALFAGLNEGDAPTLASLLQFKWPEDDARRLQLVLKLYIDKNDAPERPRPDAGHSFVDDCIKAGENKIRMWKPGRR